MPRKDPLADRERLEHMLEAARDAVAIAETENARNFTATFSCATPWFTAFR